MSRRAAPNRVPTMDAGFTLLEMLVAIAVFAIMAAMAYGGLMSVLHTRHDTTAHMERLTQLQTAYMDMERDLQEVTPRPIRDQLGSPEPALMGGTGAGVVVEATRGGYQNPAGLRRSTLQRVAYRLQDGRLIRDTWTVLDRAQDSAPQETDLLDDVQSVDIRFMDQHQQWQDTWPPPGTGQTPVGLVSLPTAVEVVMELKDWGHIRWLFRLPD